MSRNACARIFVGDDGRPLKFRIQPNLDARLRQHLESCITNHGGAVISNVPVRGFVVVDPDSVVGKALIGEWAWVERPGRRFVSTTYVQNCVDARVLLPIRDVEMPRMPLMLKTAPIESLGSGSKFIRPSLSEKQQLELTHYLAGIEIENRTSNQTFRSLVTQNSKFPWLDGAPWQAFRNDYCKHKRSYDRRIKEILRRKERTSSQIKFIDLRTFNTSAASARQTTCSLRSVKHVDLDEVSVAKSNRGARNQNIEKNPVLEPIDIDDMRSCSFLCSALKNSQQGQADGPSMQDIFPPGQHTRLNELDNDALDVSLLFDDDDGFSEALAKETKLTVVEVKQKLASFSGDRERAKAFLFRCRQTIDDLFFQSFDVPSSISQA